MKKIERSIAGLFERKKGFICDMDGVIYHGDRLLDGVKEFVDRLTRENKNYLFLTNSSASSPRELAQKLERMGLEVGAEHFYTSALATASFLKSQCPGGSAYVIGDPGLVYALYDAGITMNDHDPDYVVVGETRTYSYEKIEHAMRLVLAGAKLIGTNYDISGPSQTGLSPACRALTAPIELATGKQAYFVGKPNPLIMRHAMETLGCSTQETVIVGDRMDTDIVAGIQTQIDTVLVLSGVTSRENIGDFPYVPTYVVNGVGDLARS